MNRILFLLLLSLLLTAPLQGMKPPTTLFTSGAYLSRLLACKRIQADFRRTDNWEDIQNTDPRVKNHVLKTIVFRDYIDYRTQVQQLVDAGADPNVPEQPPLAIALHHNDIEFAVFLLEHYADPNLFVNTKLIDVNTHQETGSAVNLSQLDGKPAFYFAQNKSLAQLCLRYGALVHLTYNNHKHDYGNVLTHVFDHASYSPDLTHHYLISGVGPYSASYASRDGSTLHHVIHTLTQCSHDNESKRLLICAEHLLHKEPKLLKSKDHDGNTPEECLDFVKKPARESFLRLFRQYYAKAGIKKTSE